MAARSAKRAKPAAIAMKPGDHVLLGMPSISDPGHWYIGRVLWADAREVLVDQQPAGTGAHRMLHVLSYVRAVGAPSFLAAYKAEAAEAVRDMRAAVTQAEQALERARDEMWARIDAFAANRPGIEAPTEKARRRRRAVYRRMGSAIPDSLAEGA